MPESALNERVSDNLKKMSKARGQIARHVRCYFQRPTREVGLVCGSVFGFGLPLVSSALLSFAHRTKIVVIERMMLTSWDNQLTTLNS